MNYKTTYLAGQQTYINRIMIHSQHIFSFVSVFTVFNTRVTTALLYPRESETREIKSLDGIWNFIKPNQTISQTTPDGGILNKWYLNDLSKVCMVCVFFQQMQTFEASW